MQQGNIVGLGGYLRSGKDTVADYLVKEYGFVKMGMSDPLHEMMLTLNPYIYVMDEEYGDKSRYYALTEALNDNKNKNFEPLAEEAWLIRYAELTKVLGYTEAKKIKGYREVLQTFGTDVVRNQIGEDTWVKLAQKRILEQTSQGKHVVMTALRFPNEVKMLAKVDGATLWIDRPELEQTSNHASETSVSQSDFQNYIVNDDTLKALYGAVDAWMADCFPDTPKKGESFDDYLLSF